MLFVVWRILLQTSYAFCAHASLLEIRGTTCQWELGRRSRSRYGWNHTSHISFMLQEVLPRVFIFLLYLKAPSSTKSWVGQSKRRSTIGKAPPENWRQLWWEKSIIKKHEEWPTRPNFPCFQNALPFAEEKFHWVKVCTLLSIMEIK